MPPIVYYGIDELLKTVEHGAVTREEAIQIVDRFSAMQVELKGSAEEVLAKSMFGFKIDEQRFIEIVLETERSFV